MSLLLKCLTLNTTKLPEMVAFYQAIGIELAAKRVDKGSAYYTGTFSGFELKLMNIPKIEKLTTPHMSLQFEVQKIETCESLLKKLGTVQIILDKSDLPYGKVLIALDPDGHSVELIQPWPQTD